MIHKEYLLITILLVILSCKSVDFKQEVIILDNEEYILENGYFEREVLPGSACKTIIKKIGMEYYYDIDSDGTDNELYLITADYGGSGTFYYLVIQEKAYAEYNFKKAIFLGDRVKPKGFEENSISGELEFSYWDRSITEPMSSTPTHMVTVVVK